MVTVCIGMVSKGPLHPLDNLGQVRPHRDVGVLVESNRPHLSAIYGRVGLFDKQQPAGPRFLVETRLFVYKLKGPYHANARRIPAATASALSHTERTSASTITPITMRICVPLIVSPRLRGYAGEPKKCPAERVVDSGHKNRLTASSDDQPAQERRP